MPSPTGWEQNMQIANRLFYGDNLHVLREHVPDESVDLVYLDPPFNSKANYNILFRSPAGDDSEAQVEAFEDTWHWNDAAEEAFDQLRASGAVKAFELLNAMLSFLGRNDMMAYLAMMAIRLVELHRKLKPTGSLYLHCDPTASHYLKILLDAIFGARAYRNEIIWDYSFRLMDLPSFFNRKHDIILFYAKSANAYFRMPKTPWRRDELIASRRQAVHVDKDGVEWMWMPGGKGNSKNKLRRIDEIIAGGKAMSDVWQIPVLSSSSKERLGYPTQKPVVLLERIIQASCPEDGIVLDPFCGCGTAVHAAQKLGRHWAGIDITHLAISLIEKRMRAAFPGIELSVEGTPRDLAAAEDLAMRDKYQFQWWVVAVLDAMPFGGKKKGADGGVDGILYFRPEGKKVEKALVSVKGGTHVGVSMIRDLHSAMMRDGAPIGVFVCRGKPTAAMEREAAAVGRFHSTTTGRSYARLQIISLEQLFQGKRPDIPFVDPHAAFRSAPREEGERQAQLI